LRHGKAERLRRLQADHELEFRWLLHGQVGGLSAFQDLIDVGCGLPRSIGLIGPIAQQAALVCEIANEGYRRQSAPEVDLKQKGRMRLRQQPLGPRDAPSQIAHVQQMLPHAGGLRYETFDRLGFIRPSI
jgi:hypothetical protein